MAALAKAKLIELDQQFKEKKAGGEQVEVQFNPESLKVTFANQLVQPQGGDQAAGTAGRQFVGAGTTKLALQLWFDVSAMEQNPVDDVRRLTQKVVYFMDPKKSDEDPQKLAPPGVRFQWGSFLFDGMVEGLEETLEFFSPDGKPLRASINLTLSQQKILKIEYKGDGRVPMSPGQTPLKAAKQNEPFQIMAAINGKPDWQPLAAANLIEDPLRMPPGRLVNLNAGVTIGGTASLSPGAGALARLGAEVSGRGLNASLGGAMNGSVSIG